MENPNNDDSVSSPVEGASHPTGQAKDIQTPGGSPGPDPKPSRRPASQFTGDSLVSDQATNNAGEDVSKYPFQMRVGADNNLIRAKNQSWGAQLAGAVIGGIGKGLLDVAENASYILDPTDAINHIRGVDTLTDNWLAQLAEDGKAKIDDALPIYKENDNPLSLDSGNVFSLLQGIIDSQVGFAIPGMGIAKAVEMGVKGIDALGLATKMLEFGARSGLADEAILNGGKAVSFAQQARSGLGVVAKEAGNYLQTGQVQEAAKALGTGFLSNYMEGKLMGLQSYNSVKDKLQAKVDNGEITAADQESIAKEAGMNVMNYNKLFLASDMFELRALFGLKNATRTGIAEEFKDVAKMGIKADAEAVAAAASKTRGFKGFLHESFGSALNEGAEEIGQNVLQSESEYQAEKKKGLEDKNQSTTTLHRWWDMATTNDSLSQGIMGALGGPFAYAMTKGSGMLDGSNKAHAEYISNQQDVLTKNLEAIKHQNLALSATLGIQQDAAVTDNKELTKAADDNVFAHLAARNFENGTVNHLERLIDDVIGLSAEDAKAQGHDEDYKDRALAMKDSLGVMENSYISFSKFENHHELFALDQQRRVMENQLRLMDRSSGAEVADEWETNYQDFMKNSKEGKKVSRELEKNGIPAPQSAREAVDPLFIASIPEKFRKLYEDKHVPTVHALGEQQDYDKLTQNLRDGITSVKAEINRQKTPEYQKQYLEDQEKEHANLNAAKKQKDDDLRAQKAKDKLRKKKGGPEAVADPSAPTPARPGPTPPKSDPHAPLPAKTEEQQGADKVPQVPQGVVTIAKKGKTLTPVAKTSAPSTPTHAPKDREDPDAMGSRAAPEVESKASGNGDDLAAVTETAVPEAGATGSSDERVSSTERTGEDVSDRNDKREEQNDGVGPPEEHDIEPEVLPTVPEGDDGLFLPTPEELQQASEELAESSNFGGKGYTEQINAAAGAAAEAAYHASFKIQSADFYAAPIKVAYNQRDYETMGDGQKIDAPELNGNFLENSDPDKYEPGTRLRPEFTGTGYRDQHDVGTPKEDIALYDQDNRLVGYIPYHDTQITRDYLHDLREHGDPMPEFEIDNVGQGVLIRTHDGRTNFLTHAFPDKTLEIGTWNGTDLITEGRASSKVRMSEPGTTGGTYMLLPMGKDENGQTLHIPVPVQHAKIGSDQLVKHSLMMAAKIWSLKTEDELAKYPPLKKFRDQIKNSSLNTDILASDGLRKYMEMFLYNKNVGREYDQKAMAEEKDSPRRNSLYAWMEDNNTAPGTHMLSMTENSIHFGEWGVSSESDVKGQKGGLFDVSRDNFDEFLPHFSNYLQQTYFHFSNKQAASNRFQAPVMDSSGNVTDLNATGDYMDFAKQFMYSNLLSKETSPGSGKYIYSIHRVMRISSRTENSMKSPLQQHEAAIAEQEKTISEGEKSLSPEAKAAYEEGLTTVNSVKKGKGKSPGKGHKKASEVVQEMKDKKVVVRKKGKTVNEDTHITAKEQSRLDWLKEVEDSFDENENLSIFSEKEGDPIEEAIASLQVPGIPYQAHRQLVEMISSDLWSRTRTDKNLNIDSALSEWKGTLEQHMKGLKELKVERQYKDTKLISADRHIGYHQTILDNWDAVKHFSLRELSGVSGIRLAKLAPTEEDKAQNKLNETGGALNTPSEAEELNEDSDSYPEDKSKLQEQHNAEEAEPAGAYESDKDFQGMKEAFDDASRMVTDQKLGVSGRMRALLGYVSDAYYTEGGKKKKTRTNMFGMPTMIGFDQAYNEVVNVLDGSPPILELQLQTLREYGNQKPYFLEIADKIEAAPKQTQYEFASAFNKSYLNMQMAIHSTTEGKFNIRIMDADSSNIQKLIMEDWKQGMGVTDLFRTDKVTGNQVIDPEKRDALVSQYREILAKQKALEDSRSDDAEEMQGYDASQGAIAAQLHAWLKAAGIDMHIGAVEQLFTKGIPTGRGAKKTMILGKSILTSPKSPINLLANRIATRSLTADLYADPVIKGMEIRAMADLQGRWTPLLMSASARNGTKSVYMHHFGRAISSRVQELKNNVDLLTHLSSLPYNGRATWLKHLILTHPMEMKPYQQNGETIMPGDAIHANGDKVMPGEQVELNKSSEFFNRFEYSTGALQILKQEGTQDDDRSSLRDLSPLDHEVAKMGFYHSEQADKNGNQTYAKYFFLTMSDKSTNFQVTAPKESFQIDTQTGKLKVEAVERLFNALIMPEIDRINSSTGHSNSAGYEQGRFKFLHFPEMNDMDIWANQEKTKLKPLTETHPEIFNAFAGMLEKQIDDKISDWRKLGVVTNEKIIVRDEKGIGRREMGDKLNFVSKESLDAERVNTIEPLLIRHMAADMRLNYLVANANFMSLFSGDPAQYWKPNKDGSKTDYQETFDFMGKRLAAEMAQRQQMARLTRNASKTYRQLMMQDVMLPSKNMEQLERIHAGNPEVIEAYRRINAADAAEYVTMKEYMDNMVGIGKFSRAKADRILRLDKAGKLTPKDIRDIYSMVMQAEKPVHAGNQPDAGILDRRIYIKSAAFPLSETLCKGMELDRLRLFMQTSGIDRAVFQSGWKVGQPSGWTTETGEDGTENDVQKPPFRIHNEDGSIRGVDEMHEDYDVKAHSLVLQRDNFGFQQDLPFDAEKEKISRVTQAARLLFANQLAMTGFELNGHEEITTGQELKNHYDALYGELFKTAKEALWDELEVTNGKPNMEKVQQRMMAEASSRGYSFNDKEALKLREGKLTQPLWATASGKRMEAMLGSIIDNNIVSISMPGGSFVLMPEVGFRGTNADMKIPLGTTSDGIQYLSGYNPQTGLLPMRTDENGKVLPAQILLPNRYKELLTGKAKTISPELQLMIGMRIPNQGHNSMAPLEVVGFLPYSEGDKIIAPQDFVKQMGSDFDVDKLYCYQYHTSIDENGQLVRYNGDNKIKHLQNQILDVHQSVLKHPQNMKAITMPLDSNELKDLATTMDSLRALASPATGTFSGITDSYQRQKFINAGMGKSGVAKFSLDTTFGAQAQGHELVAQRSYGNLNYRIRFGGEMSNTHLFEELTTDKKKFILDVLKGYQTASVDNENNPILDKLNINKQTMPVVTALAAMGFDEKVITHFMNQPIVRDWAEAQVNNRSKFGKGKSDYLSRYASDQPAVMEPAVLERMADAGIEQMATMISAPDTYPNFKETQLALHTRLLTLLDLGKAIGAAEATINTESAGIKPSMLESAVKEKMVLDSAKIQKGSINVLNTHRLLGDFKVERNRAQQLDLLKDGYQKLGAQDLYFKPTTYAGHASFHGLIEGNKLWRNAGLLPYNTKLFDEMWRVAKSATIAEDLDYAEEVKLQTKVYDALVSYLYSKPGIGFGNNIADTRRRLFFDSKQLGNKSLAKELQEYKGAKADWLAGNAFLNKLSFDIKAGQAPSLIKYNPGSGKSFEEEIIYGGFLDLVANPKVINSLTGRTTADLARDLAAYSYLAGGKQGFTDYIRYVPVALLEQMGFNAGMRSINWNNFQSIHPGFSVAHFITQFIQHNPDMAREFEVKNTAKIGEGKIQTLTYNEDGKLVPMAIAQPIISVGGKLYQTVTPGLPRHSAFQETSVKGSSFFQEYDMQGVGMDSLVGLNNKKDLPPPTASAVARPPSTGTPQKQKPVPITAPVTPVAQKEIAAQAVHLGDNQAATKMRQILMGIAQDPAINPFHGELSSEYAKIRFPENFNIVTDQGKNSYDSTTGTLSIHAGSWNSPSGRAEMILHEMGHVALTQVIRDHFKTPNPKVAALLETFMKSKELIERTYSAAELEDFKDTVGRFKQHPQGPSVLKMMTDKGYAPEHAGQLLKELYAVSDPFEFSTMALEDLAFQTRLNSITDPAFGGKLKGKSVWEHIKDLLTDIFRSMGMKIEPGSALEYAFKQSLDLIKSNQETEAGPQGKKQEALTAPSTPGKDPEITGEAPGERDSGTSEGDQSIASGKADWLWDDDDKAPVTPAPAAPDWAKKSANGYEVSSKGDKRFSALTAKLADGRTIEEAYQLDVKGYRAKGDDWKAGKGKPPLTKMSQEESWKAYLGLWQQWAKENPGLVEELREKADGKTLTDQFATTKINQARALATILSDTTSLSPFDNRELNKDSAISKMQDMGLVTGKITGEYFISRTSSTDPAMTSENAISMNLAAVVKLNDLYDGKLLSIVPSGDNYIVRVNQAEVHSINQERGFSPGNKTDLGTEVSAFKLSLSKAHRELFDKLKGEGRLSTKCN